MKTLPLFARDPARRGAALLLSLLILLVLVAIVLQISMGTNTAARVARNDVSLSTMDLAIESSLLQVYDKLKTDGEQASSGAGGQGAASGASGPQQTPSVSPAGSGGAADPNQADASACDSKRDEWAQPQRTEINEMKERILVQDEDSKINVLTMLQPDENAAKDAFERVVRVLDMCREGTEADIDARRAEDMAKAMLEYMSKRKQERFPRAKLLTDDDSNEDLYLPRSLKEFAVLKPFLESDFRDFKDARGHIVHSIGSFLTVWSSVMTVADKPKPATTNGTGQPQANQPGSNPQNGSKSGTSPSSSSSSTTKKGSGAFGGAQSGSQTLTSGSAGQSGGGQQSGSAGSAIGGGAQSGGQAAAGGGASGASGAADTGGYAVNLNTAPPAVLKALFDERDVRARFWDEVIKYRNLEEEKDKDKSKSPSDPDSAQKQPQLDEWGQEMIERRIFETLAELDQVEGWKELSADIQTKIKSMLTVQSHVFSIFIVARRSTGVDSGDSGALYGDAKAMRLAEERGDALVRVVRSVVWRHKVGDEMAITPLIRWEVLDYVPYEVLDLPEDEQR